MKRFFPDGPEPASATERSSRGRGGSPAGASRRLVLSDMPSIEALRSTGFRGARARDFEDFVTGDRGRATPALPLPDPSFRERLRRHLWRIQILTRRDRGNVRH
jgi:hypothetical protein